MDPLQVGPALRAGKSSRAGRGRGRVLRRLVFGWLFMDLARFRLVVRLLWLYQRLGAPLAGATPGHPARAGPGRRRAPAADARRRVRGPARRDVPGTRRASDRRRFFAGCVMSTALADVDRATSASCSAPASPWPLRRARAAAARCTRTAATSTARLELAQANIAAFEASERADRRQLGRLRRDAQGLRRTICEATPTGPSAREDVLGARQRPERGPRPASSRSPATPATKRSSTRTPATCCTRSASAASRASCCARSRAWSCVEIAEAGPVLRQRWRLQRDQSRSSRGSSSSASSTTRSRSTPELIVTANPGCLLQLRAGLRERGSRVAVKHLAEVLDEATAPVTHRDRPRAARRATAASSTAPAELRTYAYDASFLTQLAPRSPDAVVIAGSTDDVERGHALRRRSDAIPVTPRGAASGQAAGAVALEGGIVLALNAMNRMLEIDVANMQVFCEPGVVHATAQRALAPHNLIFPPDPGSSRMATVGGMASTNAHGMRAVKYGPTSAWVLGLEVVLPDGAGHRDRLGRLARQAVVGGPGADQAHRRRRGHARRRHAPAAEADGDPAGARHRARPVRRARAGRPGGAGGVRRRASARRRSRSWTSAASRRSTSTARPWHLPRVEAMHAVRGRRQPAGRALGRRAHLSRSSGRWRGEPSGRTSRRASTRLWEARSLVGAAVGTLRPGSNRAYCGEDICVPVARIPETLRAIQEISARHRIPIATYGHIGGGGLHPGILIDGRDPDEIQRVLRVADEIHQLALRMGGTTTGEHGVGAARAPYMAAGARPGAGGDAAAQGGARPAAAS